ncbi:hypothetical protein RAS1_00890 [Phycisphaerae bacterium RAS1]|nr:hypothetical protein RAS1_00890 [Phycisphaerae bacterium RAS1]
MTNYPFCHGNPRTPVKLTPNSGSPSTWQWTPYHEARYCKPDASGPCFVGPEAPSSYGQNAPCPFGGVTANNFDLAYYPFVFALSDGTLYSPSSPYGATGGSQLQGRKLRPAFTDWQTAPTPPIPGGAAVMFGKDRIMLAGGTTVSCGEGCGVHNPNQVPSKKAYVIEMSQSSPEWVAKADMHNARVHFYLIGLPDGNILSVGGTRAAPATPEPEYIPDCYVPNGVLEPELYNPSSNVWTELAPMGTPRQYHSTVLLLPDGSVIAAGGQLVDPYGAAWEQNNQWTYQIYKPPYFFQGLRPVINDAPESTPYNDTFVVDVSTLASSITAVRLIRPGSVTHSVDFDQRVLDLQFATSTGYEIRVAAPPNANEAPPGYYLLFVCTGTNGSLPSEGRFIRIGA